MSDASIHVLPAGTLFMWPAETSYPKRWTCCGIMLLEPVIFDQNSHTMNSITPHQVYVLTPWGIEEIGHMWNVAVLSVPDELV